MKTLAVRSKVWLEVDGRAFLGSGRYRLLQAVHRHGSINAAAREFGTSYRKAWAQLQAMEEIAPFAILERRVGGKGGGASQLTAEALQLMDRYECLCRHVNQAADHYFSTGFAESTGP